jgi:hypothetical protein
MHTFFVLYSAGTVGALVSTLVGWGMYHMGLFAVMGSTLAPQTSMSTLYPRLVFGGLWALLIQLPGLNRLPWLQAGFLLSLFPFVAQCLYFLPSSGSGWFGSHHGWGTAVVVFLIWLIWGLTTSLTSSLTRR